MNTFNHYNLKTNNNEVGNFSYYFKVNFTKDDTTTEKNNIYVNMKINTGSKAEYTINTYVVDEDFIRNKRNNTSYRLSKSIKINKIDTVFNAANDNNGSVIMKQIEISANEVKKLNTTTAPYIYITLETGNKNVNYVKTVITLYDLTANVPLIPNQLYIQKFSPKKGLQLLLERANVKYKKIGIEYASSASSKFKIAVGQLLNNVSDISAITKNDTTIGITDEFKNRKHILNLTFDDKSNSASRFIGLNIIPNVGKDDEDSSEYLIFKYKNDDSAIKEIFTLNPTVKNGEENEKLYLKVNPVLLSNKEDYTISYVVTGYYKDDLKQVEFSSKELDIYLQLKDVSPQFTKHFGFNSKNVKKEDLNADYDYSMSLGDYKLDYYYITVLGIVQYNDREEYFEYNSEFEEDSSSLWIVLLIIILIIGLIVGGVFLAHYIIKNRRGTAVEREISKFMKFEDEEDFKTINENRVY